MKSVRRLVFFLAFTTALITLSGCAKGTFTTTIGKDKHVSISTRVLLSDAMISFGGGADSFYESLGEDPSGEYIDISEEGYTGREYLYSVDNIDKISAESPLS